MALSLDQTESNLKILERISSLEDICPFFNFSPNSFFFFFPPKPCGTFGQLGLSVDFPASSRTVIFHGVAGDGGGDEETETEEEQDDRSRRGGWIQMGFSIGDSWLSKTDLRD